MNLSEVAALAGVSKSTVSRVLNHKANVSTDAHRAVQAALLQLGYQPELARRRGRPSKAAAGLRTGTIALLLSHDPAIALSTPLGTAIAHGVESALAEHNLSLILAHLRAPDHFPPCLIRRQIDGALVHGTDLAPQLLARLAQQPCVWLFEHHTSLPFDQLAPDDQAIGTMAAHWLAARGCRHFACLTPNPLTTNHRRRIDSFIGAARACAITVTSTPCSALGDQIHALLQLRQPPDGFFSPGSDDHTETIYRTLVASGRQPAAQFQLLACSHDAHRLRLLDPRIASIDIRPAELARSAVDLLLWRLANPAASVRRILLAARIIEPA